MSQDANKRIVQPSVSFEGRCEEALEVYRKLIGAEVTVLLRYKDSPDPGVSAPDSLDKVMHAVCVSGKALCSLPTADAEASQALGHLAGTHRSARS
jgi:PhnB protein